MMRARPTCAVMRPRLAPESDAIRSELEKPVVTISRVPGGAIAVLGTSAATCGGLSSGALLIIDTLM
jgi:hypothetical protein